MFFATIATVAFAVTTVSATEDSCASLCNQIDGCKTAKYGSYCKAWQNPSVCFGLVRKDDGSYCFQPTDKDCYGDAVACDSSVTSGTTAAPVTATTAAPVTTITTAPVTTITTAPLTTTTAAPVTATTAAPVTTITTAPVTTITTAPVTTITTAPVTTTTAAPVTTTTAAPVTTTTAAPVTTTTAAPVTTTTAAPVTTTTTTTTTSTTTTTTSTTTTTTSTTTTTTSTATTTTTTTTSATTVKVTTTTAPFGGVFCGNVMGESFKVDFEGGHATISVMGMAMHADYKVDGNQMDFYNYDATLTKLMHMMNIDGVDATIVDSNDVHIKIGFLIDTTVTRC